MRHGEGQFPLAQQRQCLAFMPVFFPVRHEATEHSQISPLGLAEFPSVHRQDDACRTKELAVCPPSHCVDPPIPVTCNGF